MTRKGLILSLYKDYPYLSEYYRMKESSKGLDSNRQEKSVNQNLSVMKQYRTVFLIIIASLCFTPLLAQKKGETKLFKNTIAKGDTTSFNKFLAKYPNSVYAPTIQAKKDSLIKSYNTTIYSKEEAGRIFSENVAAAANGIYGVDYVVLSARKDNKEYIVGAIAPSKEDPYTIKIVRIDETAPGQWQESFSNNASRYMQDEMLKLFSMASADDLFCGKTNVEEVIVDGEKYLFFQHLNYTEGTAPRTGWQNNGIELVSNLVSMTDGTLFSSIYAGERNGNEIEGSCADMAQGGIMATPQINWLMRSFGKSPQLKPFNKEKELTRKAIQWWYDNNPQGASKLNFGVLEESHPIVIRFLEDKYIESSKSNKAAFFDIMGTTVICNYNKGTKQYLLLHCEKQPANTKTEKSLNTLYFEKENTIVLYYYKGRQAIKERIDLNAKTKR